MVGGYHNRRGRQCLHLAPLDSKGTWRRRWKREKKRWRKKTKRYVYPIKKRLCIDNALRPKTGEESGERIRTNTPVIQNSLISQWLFVGNTIMLSPAWFSINLYDERGNRRMPLHTFSSSASKKRFHRLSLEVLCLKINSTACYMMCILFLVFFFVKEIFATSSSRSSEKNIKVYLRCLPDELQGQS